MKGVLLVCSVHHETGLANVSGLHSLLERIRPEVIFLEIPPAHLDDYVNGTRTDLEATAVSRYRKLHPVELVPVDLTTPRDELIEFKQRIDYLFDRVEEANREFLSLNYWNTQFVGAFGFAYLNSASSSALWSAIHDEMRTTIARLDDRRLIEVHAEWTHANRLREETMMKGVDTFSRMNSFETGVWLVGSAHRQSIINLSRRERGAPSHIIQWDLSEYLQEPNSEA